MTHVLRVLPDVDRVTLMARGRQDSVVPCPGFSWSGSCLVVSAPGPVRWPEVEDLGACTFAGVLDDVLPPRVGPRPLARPEDPMWVAAAQEVVRRWPFTPYMWAPDGWRCRASGRQSQPDQLPQNLAPVRQTLRPLPLGLLARQVQHFRQRRVRRSGSCSWSPGAAAGGTLQ